MKFNLSNVTWAKSISRCSKARSNLIDVIQKWVLTIIQSVKNHTKSSTVFNNFQVFYVSNVGIADIRSNYLSWRGRSRQPSEIKWTNWLICRVEMVIQNPTWRWFYRLNMLFFPESYNTFLSYSINFSNFKKPSEWHVISAASEPFWPTADDKMAFNLGKNNWKILIAFFKVSLMKTLPRATQIAHRNWTESKLNEYKISYIFYPW